MQSKFFHIAIVVLLILLFVGLGLGYWCLSKQIKEIETSVKLFKKDQKAPSSVDLDLTEPPTTTPDKAEPEKQTPEQIMSALAKKVALAIKDKDMSEWSTYVHPEKGVRFSPYAYVEKDHLVFTAEDFEGLLNNDKEYNWGAYDGTGLPIEETFQGYYDRFIYEQDFANPEKVGINKVISTGNTIVNIAEFYSNPQFIELHFTQTDPEIGDMSWRSLFLVFEELDGDWYLVGVAHSEWTI